MNMRKGLIFIAVVAACAFGFAFLLAAITGGAPQSDKAPTWFIGMVGGVSAGVFYLLLSNNRKMPLADDAERARALLGPGDGGAQLLVVREGFYGKASGIDVSIDGTVRTQLKSPRFAAIDLAPGRHEVQAELQRRRSVPLVVELAAGETRVVRLKLGMGKPGLSEDADVAAARAALADVPMVAS